MVACPCWLVGLPPLATLSSLWFNELSSCRRPRAAGTAFALPGLQLRTWPYDGRERGRDLGSQFIGGSVAEEP